MKKIFSLIVMVVLTCKLSAQTYQLPVKELTDSFLNIYSQTDKATNFFSRLSTTSRGFFSPGNKSFTAAVTALGKELKINSDSSANLIFDTVLNNYIQNHFLDEYPGMLEKDKELYEYYNRKICFCISDKIKKSSYGKLKETDMQNCAMDLLTDTSYVNTLRKLAGSKTVNEMYAISQLASLYTVQRCHELTNYFVGIIKENSIYEYLSEVKYMFRDADYTIVTLYKKNDFTSLASLFPGYKNFESTIKQISSLFNKRRLSILPKQELTPSGKLNFTKTYYYYQNKKPVIVGQVFYTIKENLPDAPVLTIKFFSPDKITNKAAINRELLADEDLLPPPPMEIIKEVRIDTSQRKN